MGRGMKVEKFRALVVTRITELEKDLRRRLFDVDKMQVIDAKEIEKQDIYLFYPTLHIKFLVDLLVLNREILKIL